MSEILEQFEKMGVIPVVAIQDAEDSMQLADTLIEGGLPWDWGHIGIGVTS